MHLLSDWRAACACTYILYMCLMVWLGTYQHIEIQEGKRIHISECPVTRVMSPEPDQMHCSCML